MENRINKGQFLSRWHSLSPYKVFYKFFPVDKKTYLYLTFKILQDSYGSHLFGREIAYLIKCGPVNWLSWHPSLRPGKLDDGLGS